MIRHNIEPFFWSSSLNWIPSRFQADIQPQIGDSKEKKACPACFITLILGITLTLTFLKSTSDTKAIAGYTSESSLASSEKLGGPCSSISLVVTIINCY